MAQKGLSHRMLMKNKGGPELQGKDERETPAISGSGERNIVRGTTFRTREGLTLHIKHFVMFQVNNSGRGDITFHKGGVGENGREKHLVGGINNK